MRCFIACVVFFPSLLWAADESANQGQAIYEKYCSVCHQDGVAGAPRFQNNKDWDERLGQKKFDELFASALKGINAMPAKGTCYECSDEDIKAALEYMLPKS
ncbi:MAG: c-type cytochrome [Proteobacteria bacterium]|nr:c-type cytochrome [Pseudomonadota bacterium]